MFDLFFLGGGGGGAGGGGLSGSLCILSQISKDFKPKADILLTFVLKLMTLGFANVYKLKLVCISINLDEL